MCAPVSPGPEAAHATYLTLLLTTSFQLDLASRVPGKEGRGARLCAACPPHPDRGCGSPMTYALLVAPLPDPSSSIRLWWHYFISCPFRASWNLISPYWFPQFCPCPENWHVVNSLQGSPVECVICFLLEPQGAWVQRRGQRTWGCRLALLPFSSRRAQGQREGLHR